MRINEIVLMPTGRLACITEVTERQVYLTYEDDGDVVNFKRGTFDQLWGAKKIAHHAHKTQCQSRGSSPMTGDRSKRCDQLSLAV